MITHLTKEDISNDMAADTGSEVKIPSVSQVENYVSAHAGGGVTIELTSDVTGDPTNESMAVTPKGVADFVTANTPLVPPLSNDIFSDAADTSKTVTPKAVADYVGATLPNLSNDISADVLSTDKCVTPAAVAAYALGKKFDSLILILTQTGSNNPVMVFKDDELAQPSDTPTVVTREGAGTYPVITSFDSGFPGNKTVAFVSGSENQFGTNDVIRIMSVGVDTIYIETGTITSSGFVHKDGVLKNTSVEIRRYH